MKRVWLLFTFIAASVPAFAQDAGWMGVTVADQPNNGVLIRSLDANGPAAKAGLQENDIILEYNGQSVAGVLQLTRVVRETPVGRTVPVRVQRAGSQRTFQVVIESAPRRGPAGIPTPDLSVLRERMRDLSRVQVTTSWAQDGLRVQSLTPQLREFFGVKGNNGVLVIDVETGSPAQRAGLRAGDVVTLVDGEAVETPAEFSSEFRSSGSTIVLKIVRDKQERDITLEGVNQQ
jgi:serine protease Do